MPVNTGYLSSSAINQVFTDGPYSGSFVTSSFSSGSILSGPTLNYKELFISGTTDNLFPCINLPIYSRIVYDPITCPPGGCATPILISASLSSSCAATYDYKYNITYNSASSIALYTKIQYSTTADFSNNIATSSFITNSNPTIPPININNLPSLPSSNYTTVYFRAFNSCSTGTTSSYSNTLSVSCVASLPITASSPFFFTLENNSSSSIGFKQGSTTYIVGHKDKNTFVSYTALTSLSIKILGTSLNTPPTKINSGSNDFPQFIITGSASSSYFSTIATSIIPQINSAFDDESEFFITTVAPLSQSSTSPNLSIWNLHEVVSSNNLTTPLKTVFASDKNDSTADVIISIDRNGSITPKSPPFGEITFTVNALTTQYYLYNPPESTCVLSGTPITLADGSTTLIDNLRGGDRVLSPSILTLPFNNDFDLSNWAINKLILTEGTAVVIGNKSYQVSEVYSINNGTLITTSTHQHLFKQNGTWNIKTTPYLMVGDYLSDKNGEEILIELIEILTGEFTVFNLNVEENDLYIANGILTHNK